MLVAKLGQDGHDRGSKAIATALADAGFDIDLSPLFSLPEEVARLAIDGDVHVVGVSSLAGGHSLLLPQLLQALKAAGAEEIAVVAGGVIPEHDIPYLYECGVKCVVGVGVAITEAICSVLAVIDDQL